MPKVRIPLVGSLTNRDQTNAFGVSPKDQRFTDCDFNVTRNPLSNQTTVWVRGRNDFVASAYPTGASGAGTAVRFWRGKSTSGYGAVVSAFGNTNSTIYLGASSLGSITGQCHFMQETAVSGTAYMLFISNFTAGGSNRAWYYPESGALTEITNTNFPAKQTPALTMVGNFAVMDGYNFIMASNGQVWHSDINSIANWSALSYIAADEHPGVGRGVCRHGQYIAAFKSTDIVFFKNAGNPAGSVLSRVGSVRVGCVSEFSICEVGDAVYFVGAEEGKIGVYKLEGMTPTKISSGVVDEILASSNGLGSILNVVTSYGKNYLLLTAGATSGDDEGWVYDFETSIWMPWTFSVLIRQSDSYTNITGSNNVTTYYVGSSQTYVMVNDVAPVSGTIQTQPIDFGSSNRKRIKRISVVGDRTASTMNLAVSWSDNDYQSFTTARNIDMSGPNPKLERCGMTRRRAFKLSGLGESFPNRSARIQALDIEYEECVL